MVIGWSDGYATGIAEMDAQHRGLIELVDRVLRALDTEPAVLERRLEFLRDFIEAHFQAEEQLLVQGGHPGVGAHRDDHRAFLRTLERLRVDHLHDGLIDSVRQLLGGWLVEWISSHITDVDRPAGEWLVSRGKAGRPAQASSWLAPSGALIRVLLVAPGDPLDRAGVQPGDLVVALAGKRVADVGTEKALSMLADPGSAGLSLTVHPDGDLTRFETRFVPRRTAVGLPSLLE
jgi:hemerythrin